MPNAGTWFRTEQIARLQGNTTPFNGTLRLPAVEESNTETLKNLVKNDRSESGRMDT